MLKVGVTFWWLWLKIYWKGNLVPLVIVTFVPHSFGKILQRDYLCLTKHIWYNQGCILMSSFVILSHNTGLCFGHWKKETIQILLFFFLFPLTLGGLPWLQNMSFCFSIHDDVGSCLHQPGSNSRKKWEDVNTAKGVNSGVLLGVWRHISILMTEMHLILTLKGSNQR